MMTITMSLVTPNEKRDLQSIEKDVGTMLVRLGKDKDLALTVLNRWMK